MALTTAARVRQRLNIPDDASGVNITASEITSLIAEVELEAARLCGVVQWESAAYDETHNGTGTEDLYLKVPFMTSVSSVTILLGGSETVTVSSDSYRLDTKSACLILTGGWDDWYGTYGCWPEGNRNVRVVGTGGFSSVPVDLTLAVTDMVCARLLDRHDSLTNASFATDGVQSAKRSIMESVQAKSVLLSPWKRVYA